MNLIKESLDLLFPPKCAFCGKNMRGAERYICDACEQKEKIRAEACVFCGREIEHCACERNGFPIYDKIVSPYYYEGGARNAIHKFKFHNKQYYKETLAREIYSRLCEVLPNEPIDLIVPVPISKKRERDRGYNQSELLAKELSKMLSCPLKSGLLLKNKDTKPQSSLSQEERKKSVKHAYTILKSEELVGRNVLLIDDIITTGATLNECAKVLKTAGVGKIVCGVFAATKLLDDF